MRKNLSLHRAVQKHILTMVPGQMEYGMEGHVADVAWLTKRIVFEVQCSPISLREAMRREADYGKMGFAVVWILHQGLFNRRVLSSTERYLRMHSTCYYTNVVASGQGMIYDQLESLQGRWRKLRSSPFSVDLARPMRTIGKLHFAGDSKGLPKQVRDAFEAKRTPSWYSRQLAKLLWKFCK